VPGYLRKLKLIADGSDLIYVKRAYNRDFPFNWQVGIRFPTDKWNMAP